jgi:hypothetical protein
MMLRLHRQVTRLPTSYDVIGVIGDGIPSAAWHRRIHGRLQQTLGRLLQRKNRGKEDRRRAQLSMVSPELRPVIGEASPAGRAETDLMCKRSIPADH